MQETEPPTPAMFAHVALPRKIILFATIYFLSQFAIGAIVHPLGAALVFKLQTTFSVAAFSQIIESWSSQGLLSRYLSHYYLDMIHPLWYGLSLYYLVVYVQQRKRAGGIDASLARFMPLVAAACDVFENLTHILMLAILDNISAWGVTLGALAANTKWTLVGLTILYAGTRSLLPARPPAP